MTTYVPDSYAGKTVLVTGGAGAIGSTLSRTLAELGAYVIIIDNMSSSERWNIPSLPNVLFVEGDILDDKKLKRVFTERPQVVFHMAAFFANQNSVDNPEDDLMTNGLGTIRLLQHAVLGKVDRFVYAGSGASVCGNNPPLPVTEEHNTLYFGTPYKITKTLGEMYCNFFHRQYGLPIAKPRLFNFYGPGEIPGQYRNVVTNFVYWGLKGMPLVITGNGDESRDFTYAGDMINGLLRSGLIEGAIGEEYNIATGVEVRINELAHLVNELTGNSTPIQYTDRRKWDAQPRIIASIEKAGRLIGYEPQTTMREGLKHTISWFEANWDKIEASARFAPGVSSSLRAWSKN